MPRDYLTLGPTPHDEDCAQVGQPDYREKAIPECKRYIRLLREKFGDEPEGASLNVKSFPHDFGTYFEVIVWFDQAHPLSIDYAFRLEANGPATWAG